MENKWIVRKIGDICEVLNGFAFKSDKYVVEGIRVIRITNVQHGYIEDNDPKFYPINECEKLNQYMLKEQDLLMSLTGNVGRVGLLDSKFLPAALNQRVACLRVKDKCVELKYLFHHLNSELFETRCIQSAKGIAQKNMSTEWLKEYSIPIPALSEQSRIVEELDLLSNIIKKKRQQLSELDNLAQSIFYDMFGDPVTNEKGWEVYTLKSITSKIGSGATPKGGNESYKDEGISLIRSLNVYNNSFKYKDLAHIDNEQAEALNNVAIECGDVLLNITGASVARCCIVPIDVLPARVNQHVSIIRGKNIINNNFLNYLLTSHAYQSLLIMLSKSNGATREALTKGQLEALKIILPPLSLQQLFAQKIEAIENQKTLIKQSIAETEELFNSRMDYYFS